MSADPRRFRLSALLCAVLLVAGRAHGAEFVQAVEFPYQQYPRHLWERELVWLKNVGIRTVAFSISAAGDKRDPRADWDGFLRLLRRVGLRGWVRGVPRETAPSLLPYLEKHGGPIAFAEGGAIDAPPPPSPVVRLSATDPSALARSRQIFAGGRGAILWQDVEDTLSPALRKGVVSFSGEERAGTAVLRRDAALLKYWAAALPRMRIRRELGGKLPGVQIYAPGPRGISAVSLSNSGATPLRGDLRVYDPSTRRMIALPAVEVPSSGSLWLPVNVPLAGGGLCEDCAAFAPPDRVVFATAELQAIEFENGILAFEFFAPVEGEIVVQLSHQPSGPLLAAGRPAEFDWNASNSTVRMIVPAAKAPPHRVRIGLAIQPPDTSGFFVSAPRLIIGHANILSTSFSSEDLANRSRLLAPPDYGVKPIRTSPLEIDYEVTVPADRVHGEFVVFALEADGVRLGRTRLQVLRPVSVRVREAAALSFGASSTLPLDPPLVSFDARAGRNLSIVVRNNFPAIRNYVLEASGSGLTFVPERADLSVAAGAEREVTVRVFADPASSGALLDAVLKLSGAAAVDQPLRLLALRRGDAATCLLDLDGDGIGDGLLENSRARATFSGSDGRWLEFVWKDSGVNLLPDSGALPMPGPVSIRRGEQGIEFSGSKGRRVVTLSGDEARVVIDHDTPLAFDAPPASVRLGVALTVDRQGPQRAMFTLQRAE